MKNALFGWTGFIGQTLFHQWIVQGGENPNRWAFFDSTNIEDARGQAFGDIYLACMPAAKWLANREPATDAETLHTILDVLLQVRASRVFIISTVDVFDCRATEVDGEWETRLTWSSQPYGRHRKEFEEGVRAIFSPAAATAATTTTTAVYTIRLPALFGPGLKKNALYDLIHDNNIEAICLDSWFQWYDVSRLSEDLAAMAATNTRLLMPVSEPIQMRELVQRLFPEDLSRCKGTAAVHYRFIGSHTKSGSKDEILESMRRFVDQSKRGSKGGSKRGGKGNILVSNIGFDASNPNAQKVLDFYGIDGIEAAPSQFEQIYSNASNASAAVRSIQGILYGVKPSFNIFWNRTEFLDRLTKILESPVLTGEKRIVFGCPRNRALIVPESEAVDLFRSIGDMCSKHGATMCLEANARAYGCTWLTTLAEVVDFVGRVDHPNIRINLDSGNYCMESDDYLVETLDMQKVGHVQIAAPYLSTEWDSVSLETARRFLAALNKSGYTGTISYEAVKPATIHEYRRGLGMFCELLCESYNL